MKKLVTTLFFILCPALVITANAQTTQIPPPSSPVAFCGVQAAPAADSFKLVFDGGAPEDVTMVTPADSTAIVSYCNQNAPAGWTHAFTMSAARFSVRQTPYTVFIQSTNAFGTTSGVTYSILVGMAPGQLTITRVGQLPQD
jgi:hypothetical protein